MVIGIAGGTGSGKTTVVKKILNLFPKKDVVMLSQDNYYRDQSHLIDSEKKNINFDHPDAIEFELLGQHIDLLTSNIPIQQPIYSYITCSRSPNTTTILPQKVILVEGILVFSDPLLRQKMDICVYVDAPADDRLVRIIRRDMVERGRDAEEVLLRYEMTVKPMHDLFIEPTKKYADIIIPQGGNNSVAIKILRDIIQTRINEIH